MLKPTPLLDLRNPCVRRAGRASHNPTAASSAAMARNNTFAFIVFYFYSSVALTFAMTLPAVSGVDLRFGTKAGNPGAKRMRAGMNPVRHWSKAAPR